MISTFERKGGRRKKYRMRGKGIQRKKIMKTWSRRRKGGENLQRVMLEAILIDDDTEKALLNTKKIDIYENNKEEFIISSVQDRN